MGYQTEFEGQFDLDKPLNPEHFNYLTKFNQTRRMKRNAEKTEKREDPIREKVGLPVGIEGEFFINEDGDYGQDAGKDVINSEQPPETQPSLWCQWVPGNSNGEPYYDDIISDEEKPTTIVWDQGEKFYNYVEWLEYIIKNFLKPWGYVLNGQVKWRGENFNDNGMISCENNEIDVDTFSF